MADTLILGMHKAVRTIGSRPSEAQQAEQLATLARIQETAHASLTDIGAARNRFVRATGESLCYTDHHMVGNYGLDLSITIPRESIRAASLSPQLDRLKQEYLAAQQDGIYGAIRFTCGRTRYLLRGPLTPERQVEVSKILGLPPNVDRQRLERHLHYRFQRLYRLPPDEWSERDAQEWHQLVCHIDFDAYQHENRPDELRIGKLIKADVDCVLIQWNGAGQEKFDAIDVPPEILQAETNAIIYATLRHRPCGIEWTSTRMEPPLKLDEMELPTQSELSTLPVAQWPKLKE